jgi:hypothetical protein
MNLNCLCKKGRGWGVIADQPIPEGAVVMEYVGMLKLKPEKRSSYKHRVSCDGGGGGEKVQEAPGEVMREDGASGEQEETSGQGEAASTGEMEDERVDESESDDDEEEEDRGARMTEEEIVAVLLGKVCRELCCLWIYVAFR